MTLDEANTLIAKLLPGDDIQLSQEEYRMYVFNSTPLCGDARSWYKEALAQYQMITNDNINLLLLETGTRFKDELSDESLLLAGKFSDAICFGPFDETTEGSGEWREKDLTGLEELVEGYRPSGQATEEMTVDYNGCVVGLSKLGATLYMGSWSLVTHVRSARAAAAPSDTTAPTTPPDSHPRVPALCIPSRVDQFNKQLENRVRPSLKPGEKVKGVARREELSKIFTAINATELKKAVKAVGLPDGRKEEMVALLIDRYAPKRARKRKTPPGAAAPAPAEGEEAEEDGEEEEAGE